MARYRLCRICKRAAVKEENGICENCGAKVAPDVLREWNSQRSDDEQHTLRAERERHQQSLTYRPSPGLSTRARLWLFAIAILLAVVISLPKITDEFAWKTLEETPEAYETYLSRYPGSWHVKAAAAVLDDLRWKVARKSNDIRGYETYLAHGHSSDKPSYWRGAHDKEATARLDELLWKSAAESDQPEDYRRYVQELPEGAHLCMAHLQLAKWSPTRTDELEKAMALCDKSSDEYQRAARENRIRGARDDAAFAIAKGRGDVRSINAYIAQYARHVSEATELLSELRLREEAARLLVALLRQIGRASCRERV